MGSFSWNKADKLTKIENVAHESLFKFLIPKSLEVVLSKTLTKTTGV